MVNLKLFPNGMGAVLLVGTVAAGLSYHPAVGRLSKRQPDQREIDRLHTKPIRY